MSEPLRLVVIGAGHLGRFHAKIAAGLDGVDLVAVVDPATDNREAVAREASTRAIADWHEIADQFDAAILATPTFTHHDIGCELLSAGKHLLVEKPLATSALESDDLVQLASQQNLTLQVGHVERFNPAFASIEPELRDPKFIEATRFSGYSFRSTDIGVVLDMMIHDIDLILALVRSPVKKIDAMGISVLGGHEDMANARITFASGCVAQLSASRVSYEMKRTMQVMTTLAYASIDFASGQTTVVRPREEVLRRETKLNNLTSPEISYLKEHLFEEVLCKTTIEAEPINAIEAEQREFLASLQHGKPVRVDGNAARDAIAVAELILEQIANHAWDGHPACRRGPFAMPSLPILSGPAHWHEEERRQAG